MMNNSLNSVINKVHYYYLNGIRVTRQEYAGRHGVSLSAMVFRRRSTLIKDCNPYNRYENVLHEGIVDDRRMNVLHWIYMPNTRMSYYRPYKQKRKYLSLFSFQ